MNQATQIDEKAAAEEKPKIIYKKDLIAEGTASGGFTNNDIKQFYKIFYMYPTDIYDPKLVITLDVINEKEGKPIQRSSSLRLTNSAQIRSYILNMIKAYFFWQKKLDQVRPDNFDYKLNTFLQDVENAIRHPENYQ